MTSSSLLPKNLSSGTTYGAIDTEQSSATPYESASQWSQLVFGWMSPLLELGHVKPQLNMSDLDLIPLPRQDTTANVMDTFTQAWQEEQQRAALHTIEPSLLRALWVVRTIL